MIRVIEPISKVFNAILHPVKTINLVIDVIIAYIPAVCIVIFLFYIVTGSPKILRIMIFIIIVFFLLKVAIVFEMIWLIIVIFVSIAIIILLGRVI